ncbi:MAG: hypothetical protein WBL45_07935, partial [Solirubrobacterales bacterium]
MTPAARRVRRNRRNLAVFGAVLALVLVLAAPGSGDPSPPGTAPLPLLGSADPELELMGAAPAGEPGEAWGYRSLPLSVGAVRVGTRQLQFGPPANTAVPDPQLVFVRHTDAGGWQVFDTPRDAAGQPYRGPFPNRLSPRITRSGGGVLVGRDTSRPVGQQVVVLHHAPGGSWRELPAPPPNVLLPVEGE